MRGRSHWLIRQSELDKCADEIRLENRTSFRLLASTGVIIGMVNLATQIAVVGSGMPLFRACLLLAVFSVLLFLDRVVVPEDKPLPGWALYLAEAPVLLVSILLGTVWDQTHQATSFLLIMLASPAFITDHPNRSMSILAGWSFLFVLLTQLVKESPVRDIDTVHAAEFFVAATAVSYTMTRIRLNALEDTTSVKYLLSHDNVTGCLNRHAFEEGKGRFIGQPVAVFMNSVDHITLFNDFYGTETSDDILKCFVRTLMEQYGKENTFRGGENEIVCVVPGGDRAECKIKAETCRKEMHAFARGGYRIAVTFAQGGVEGTPETKEQLYDMLQLARIYSHQAGAQGRDKTIFSVFSEDALAEASAAANISSTNAKGEELDPLTGLPTMSYFCLRVDEMMNNMVDLDALPGVGYFKLTMMKEYNDEFGYRKGDKLITDTGRILQEAFPYRLVGHITAGQFCFFCYRNEAEEGIERVLKELERTHTEFRIRGKAGFAEHTEGQSASGLLDLARIAQRSILNRPEQVFCQYNLDLDEDLRFRQYIVNHLEEAIEQEWLEVYYQPIVRAATGKVCFEEALSRWNDPKMGFLMPFRFIQPLEEKGLMYRLNLYVVERVLRDRRRRQLEGVPVVPVSVNLSRNDFLKCDMVKEISERVSRAGCSPDVLRIEITESAFIGNQELLRREVMRFRENGFRVWMDDFGSEYSTLNLLQEIDFDLVKIDMRFIRNLKAGEKNYVIISNVLRMNRELGVVTLSEGVETEEQEQLLKELDCNLLQGYLFSKPVSLRTLTGLVKNGEGLAYEQNGTGNGEQE